ncbi:leucine-rich repeat and IQ domain-containing protein 4-like [Mytilus edulis]|uniref:leucine-rich repeat and IQ domain-containing protein 4-like n=1 Tax=Mytilus edulis TaxID=6550 RepID=UPI0039F0C95F
MPVQIKEFHMTTCKDFVVVEVGVLFHFPHLKVLNLTNSNFHLTQALQLLHPFQNKSMDAILFRGITHAGSQHGLDPVILTPEMMRYISTICIKTLDLSNNKIVIFRNRSLVLFQHPECFENMMLSANSFSLETLASSFFPFVRRMINIEVFDFSYFPLEFKDPIFLDVVTNVNHTRVEKVQHKVTGKVIPITVTLTNRKLKYLRITHRMATMYFKEFRMTNSSLRHLELSYFETDLFPILTFEGFNSLEYLDLSGISSDITVGVGKVPLLIHLKTLILKETKLYNVLQTNVSIFCFCPNIMNLDISHNYIWKIKSIGELRNLKLLNLSHNLLDNVPMVVTKLEN